MVGDPCEVTQGRFHYRLVNARITAFAGHSGCGIAVDRSMPRRILSGNSPKILQLLVNQSSWRTGCLGLLRFYHCYPWVSGWLG